MDSIFTSATQRQPGLMMAAAHAILGGTITRVIADSPTPSRIEDDPTSLPPTPAAASCEDQPQDTAAAAIAPADADSCPELSRILSGDLTLQERDHVEACDECQDAVAYYRETAGSRLRQVFRRIRPALPNWKPLLQFLAVLLVIGAVAAGIGKFRAPAKPLGTPPPLAFGRAAPGPSGAGLLTTASAAPLVFSDTMAKRQQLALQFENKIGWPWNTCGLQPEVVNQWLGQGTARLDIEQNMDIISRATSKNPRQRQEAAQYWCNCLSAGSVAIGRLAQRKTAALKRQRVRQSRNQRLAGKRRPLYGPSADLAGHPIPPRPVSAMIVTEASTPGIVHR
jgi:hypothetical protein